MSDKERSQSTYGEAMKIIREHGVPPTNDLMEEVMEGLQDSEQPDDSTIEETNNH